MDAVKGLLSLLDYYSYAQYLEGKDTPFDTNWAPHIRKEGFRPVAKDILVQKINNPWGDSRMRKALSQLLGIADTAPISSRQIFDKLLSFSAGRKDLKQAVSRVNASLVISSGEKKLINTLLIILDFIDQENHFEKNLPPRFAGVFKEQGMVPAIKLLFSSLKEEEKRKIARVFNIDQPLSPSILLARVLNRPGDDHDLLAALCKLDAKECPPPPPRPIPAPVPLRPGPVPPKPISVAPKPVPPRPVHVPQRPIPIPSDPLSIRREPPRRVPTRPEPPKPAPPSLELPISSIRLSPSQTTVSPFRGMAGKTVMVAIEGPLKTVDNKSWNLLLLLKNKLPARAKDFSITIGSAAKIEASVKEVSITAKSTIKFVLEVKIGIDSTAGKYPIRISAMNAKSEEVQIYFKDRAFVVAKPRNVIGCSKFSPALQPAKAASGECDPNK